ncbi:SPOR domain-containing protein [Antarctobacter heliothermus]|uniref:Sporulation related domain-containing protein n=1 Tax=Antarctobacter heliothermus TaxID=74033 RepID=A0A239HQ57_9RHOB|nr:SPOR domain-containing protein [Antarctobacter heliothermus]SNS82394.1 Sporulation related domain-containing protein [Antarctobacter heliothermus]
MSGIFFHPSRTIRLSTAGMALLLASGCADGQMPGFLKPKTGGEEVVSRASTADTRGTPRDVEAPEVFEAKEAGLWDGRPSLGGVWVAHPDAKDPERVIVRNQQNGKFVIGALFRKERETPGPRLQVSSDAAAALGLLAGQPTNLDVVALRREEAPEPETADPLADTAALAPGAMPPAPDVSATALDPVLGGAAAVIDGTTPTPPKVGPEAAIKRAAAPAKPVADPSKLGKPYIQIGIFSVEQNAKNTATSMRQAGMVPTIKTHSSKGKTFWRVVVGPAQSKTEMATLLKTIKGNGFTDAYAVTD